MTNFFLSLSLSFSVSLPLCFLLTFSPFLSVSLYLTINLFHGIYLSILPHLWKKRVRVTPQRVSMITTSTISSLSGFLESNIDIFHNLSMIKKRLESRLNLKSFSFLFFQFQRMQLFVNMLKYITVLPFRLMLTY